MNKYYIYYYTAEDDTVRRATVFAKRRDSAAKMMPAGAIIESVDKALDAATEQLVFNNID